MLRLILLTSLALLAFAANSLLARAALAGQGIGAAEFTLIRLVSGAIMLALLIWLGRKSAASQTPKATLTDGSWFGAAMLLLYAGAFSFAYVHLDTGTGALALFTAVQLTMIGRGVFTGQINRVEMIGAIIAFMGFVYLTLPAFENLSTSRASLIGFTLMSISGLGWGVYSILGKTATTPLAHTGGNFWRASVLALPLLVLALVNSTLTSSGFGLAVLSGAVTSGMGYAIWYAVLPALRTGLAASLQLLVPPLAALMGWAVLSEVLTLRLLIATLIISAGISLVIFTKAKVATEGVLADDPHPHD